MQCVWITQSGRQCRRTGDDMWGGNVPLCQWHFSTGLELENERRRERIEENFNQRRQADRAKLVYYVEGHGGFIKIGFTGNLNQRLADLRRLHGDLRLLASHTGGHDAEQALHRQFVVDRVEGEWFFPSDDLRQHIARVVERSNSREVAS